MTNEVLQSSGRGRRAWEMVKAIGLIPAAILRPNMYWEEPASPIELHERREQFARQAAAAVLADLPTPRTNESNLPRAVASGE